MSPLLLKTTNGFQITVDSLMSSRGSALCSCIRLAYNNITVSHSFLPVAIVSFHHLTWKQHEYQSSSKDVDIRPLASRKGAIHLHNGASLNTHSQFISQSSMLEFVGEVLPVSCMRLLSWN
jgi:hypothetical protein